MTSNADLSTHQAADLLNVSHPFLISLDSGEVASRVVGAHRRVDSAALMDSRRRDDHRRREAADGVVLLTERAPMWLHLLRMFRIMRLGGEG